MLNERGRLEGLFSVINLGSTEAVRTSSLSEQKERAAASGAEEFLLIADGGDASALHAALTRYIVADRVNVESRPCRLFHVWGGKTSPAASGLFVIPRKRLRRRGWDIIAPGQSPQIEIRFPLKLLSESEWYSARFEAGHPCFPEELGEGLLLSECGLQDIRSPGRCFIGQEAVEKSESRGKVPRGICRFIMAGGDPQDLASGSQVQSGDGSGRRIGMVLSCRFNAGFAQVFAAVRNSEARAGAPVTVGSWKGQILDSPPVNQNETRLEDSAKI